MPLTPDEISSYRSQIGAPTTTPSANPAQMSGSDLANHYLSLAQPQPTQQPNQSNPTQQLLNPLSNPELGKIATGQPMDKIPAPFPVTGNEGTLGTVAKTLGNLPTSAINFGTGIVDFLNPIKSGKSISDVYNQVSQYANQTKQTPLDVLWKSMTAPSNTNIPGTTIQNSALGESAGKVMGGLIPKFFQSLGKGDLQGAIKSNAEDPVGTWAPLVLLAKGIADQTGNGPAFDSAVHTVASPVTEGIPNAIQGAGQAIAGGAQNAVQGAGNVLSAARDYITPMDENVKNILQNGNPDVIEPKLTTLLDQAKTAVDTTGAPTPYEITGRTQLGGALKDLSGQLTDLGGQKATIVSQINDLVSQDPEAQSSLQDITDKAVENLNNKVSDLGLQIKEDGSIAPADGKVSSIPAKSADIGRLAQINDIMTQAQDNPTFENINNAIDAMQEIAYKAKAVGAEPMSTELGGLIKSQVGALNLDLKDFAGDYTQMGVGDYGKVNSDYAKTNDLYNQLNTKLGTNMNRAGSVVKSIFSSTDSGTKNLVTQLEDATGRPIFEDATLSKFAMDVANDPRARTLIAGQGTPPLTTGGLMSRILDYVSGKIVSPEAKAFDILQANREGGSNTSEAPPNEQGAVATPETTNGELTIEQQIEQKGGWQPGMKAQFDTALAYEDATQVKNLLPQVPDAYQVQFQDKINSILGTDFPKINVEAHTPNSLNEPSQNEIRTVLENMPDNLVKKIDSINISATLAPDVGGLQKYGDTEQLDNGNYKITLYPTDNTEANYPQVLAHEIQLHVNGEGFSSESNQEKLAIVQDQLDQAIKEGDTKSASMLKEIVAAYKKLAKK